MTENPKEARHAPSNEVTGAAPSPYDSPTGELPIGKIPRTDEELGLDPQVPTAEQAAAAQAAFADAQDSATAATEAISADTKSGDAPTYAFASIPPAPTPSEGGTRRLRRPEPRGTQNLGLLCLRLVIGLSFLYHGLQKAAGWFHGPGLDGTRAMLEHGGWKHGELSTAMLVVAEVGGGVLVLVGLITPLAAGALLADIIGAWLWKQGADPGLQYKPVELETILGALSATLILTGPGRLSFDRNRGWATKPLWGSIVVLILAVLAGVGSWIYLHGGNPFK